MKTKILMLALTCALLDVISFQAQADAIYVGAWSKHINPDKTVVNEKHDLVGVEYKGYMVTSFENSFGHHTVAIGKRFELFETENFKGAVYLGASYGYRGSCNQGSGKWWNERVVCPAVVPEIAYTKHRTQIAVSLMGNAVAIGPKWEF